MKHYTKEEICNLNPYDLLELALEDLERIEKDPKYAVNMDDWHVPVNGICYVCLAGSVLTRFLGPNVYFLYFCCDQYENIPIWALNCFRNGYINSGLGRMGYKYGYVNVDIPKYSTNPGEFKRKLREILKMFKENPPVKKE